MKLNQIALAIVALSAGAANAAAIAPNLVVYLDGATAVAGAVTDVATYLCKDGTGATTKILSNASAKINAVYCSAGVKADSGLNTSTKVLLIKNNKDGSLETFERVLMKNALTTTLVSTMDDACGTTCPTTAVNAHGGFSDVDEKVWIGRGQFIASDTDVGSYTVKSGFAGQGFGLSVTDKLYAALQTAQGLASSDVPNITSQQFTAILSATGGYKGDWAPILDTTATPTGGDGFGITLCRRTTASGTQASMDSFFLKNPCQTTNEPTYGYLESVRASDYPLVGRDTAGFAVVENAGTGDVKTCLTTRNSSTDGTEYAIGVMSLENDEATGYKYVKLDGVSPKEDGTDRRASVVDGRYNFTEEMVLVYRNDASAGVKTYLNNFARVMSDPSKVNPLKGLYTPNGADLGAGVYATRASLPAYAARIHRGNRGGNACQPIELAE